MMVRVMMRKRRKMMMIGTMEVKMRIRIGMRRSIRIRILFFFWIETRKGFKRTKGRTRMIMRTRTMMRARMRIIMKAKRDDSVDGEYLEQEDSGKRESHHLARRIRIRFIILTLAKWICQQRNKYFSPNVDRFVESQRL